mgnify:FL=1|jgi:hypothetical protein|tara:strand:+ start:309 stop:491 length:183 start_codon:yes stop_codon:yes gene_type:complete
MAMGVNHYLKDGKIHRGGTHKHPDGKVMTGKAMSKTSKNLFHYSDLSKTAQKTARKSWGK